MPEFSLGEATLGTSVDLSGLDNGIADAEQKGGTGFAKIGDVMGNALKVGIVAAGVAVVAAVGAIGVAALDTAGQVEQASNDIQAELGVTEEEANRLGDVALKVWGENWGDSIDDVKTSIVTVRQQMKGLADEDLEAVTAKALALRDSFGIEVAESTNAANTLMKNFGLTSQQAFDFIAAGQQKGLNASGDFLDTIGEYSVQFANGGASADQFFSLMESGLQGGVLGTDKAADAFKEFQVRILDGSKTTKDAMAQLGLADVLAGIEDGTITVADGMGDVIDALSGLEDPAARMQLGVALIGTQFEDLGNDAVLALDMSTTSLEDMAGATDSLNAKYNNWPAMWEGIKRSALVAIEPLGEKLLGIANEIMPTVQLAVGWIGTNLPPLIDQAITAIATLITTFQGILVQVQPVIDFIGANLEPMLAGLAAVLLTVVVPAFVAWAGAAFTSAAATIAALAPVVAPLAAIGAAVALLYAAWQNDFGGIRTIVTDFWETTGKPIFDQIVTWLQVNIPIALQTVSDFWTNTLLPALSAVWAFIQDSVIPIVQQLVGNTFTALNTKTQEVSDFWTTTLQPALSAVWSFLNTYVIPLFTALANVTIALVKKEIELLAALWNNVLKPALNAVWSFIQANVVPILQTLANTALADVKASAQAVSDFWNGTLKPAFEAIASVVTATLQPALSGLETITSSVATWLGNIGDAVSGVIDWFTRLSSSIDAIEIPSWLKGQSPPPLAEWFDYIGESVEGVKDMLPSLGSVIQTVADTMRSNVKKMTEEVADDIQKTTEDLQKKAEQVQDALTSAIIGGFSADADIARLKARNLDAIDELGEAGRKEAEKQLALAEQMAAAFSDPEQAAAFFKERSSQILELAELQDELSAAETEADKARLQKKIDLIKLAQEAERSALSLQEPDTALGGVIAGLEGFLMDDSVRSSMGGILDDPTGTLRGLTDLLGQLRGANTSPVGPAAGMVFNIDARGSTMTPAEYEASMRKVLNETGRSADWRRRTGGS